LRYFDTSVILLSILNDPRRDEGLKYLKQGGLTSELGLVELVSYLSRNLNEDPLPYAIKIVNTFNIKIMNINGLRLSPFGDLTEVAHLAINVSRQVKLRTLDLLHLTYAILLNVDEIITADKEFLKAEKFLKERNIALNIVK